MKNMMICFSHIYLRHQAKRSTSGLCLPAEQDIRANPLTSCAVDLNNEVEAAVDRLILIVLPTKTSRRLLVVAIELKASVVVARTPTSRKTATLEMRTIGDEICVCNRWALFYFVDGISKQSRCCHSNGDAAAASSRRSNVTNVISRQGRR